MASELELAGLLSQVEDDAGDEEIFAAQWQHESDNEPLAAAVYLMSNADPARIAGGAAKVKALRSAAKKYSMELSADRCCYRARRSLCDRQSLARTGARK